MNISGDNSIVEYPLFQTECGGAIPTSPLQLLIYEISPAKACQLNAQWHSRLPRIDESNILRNTHQVCFAAAFENEYYAVAVWSSPVAQNWFKDGKTILELRRFAIRDNSPPNTATRMLSVMRKMVVRKFPELTRLISYQDEAVHHGTIYKADNWTAGARKETSFWNDRKRNPKQATGAKTRWEYKVNK